MRGYGVPDGLATLAHAAKRGKTRCAPFPRNGPLPAAHPRAARSFGGSASPGAPSPVGRLAGGLRAGATVLTLIFGSHPVRLALWASSRPATRPIARPARLRSQPLRALFGRVAQEVFRSAPKSRRSVRAPAPETNRNGERCFGRGSAHPETLSRLAARRLVPRTPRARSRSAPADADRYGSSRATAGVRSPAGS